jgi:hypothetical protein
MGGRDDDPSELGSSAEGLGISLATETALDIRRRMARLIRFDIVPLEWSESDESELLELLSEPDESSQLATGPGVASSSMICCGVDSYRYEWEMSWKSRYTMYTSRRTCGVSLCWRSGTSELTTLVPRLILRDCLSAKS